MPEAAAGEQETAGDAGGPSAAADTSEYSKEPVTLTAFINSVMMPTDWKWGDDPTSQKITELTGVTLDIQYATTTDNMELNTMLASGEKLPDFIITPANGPVRPLLVDQGFVLPYNDLIEQYAPHLGEIMPKNMDKIYTEPDGKFYCTVSFFGDAVSYTHLPWKDVHQKVVDEPIAADSKENGNDAAIKKHGDQQQYHIEFAKFQIRFAGRIREHRGDQQA